MTRAHRIRRVAFVLTVAALAAAASSRAQIHSPLYSQVAPELEQLVDFARRDIDTFWRARVPNYQSPADVVMIHVPAVTDCGEFKYPNAKYCSTTNKIYWDAGLFTEQHRFGPFAPAFILAHEWGHLVQRQLGFLSASRGLISIQVELQADCLAGMYAADARTRGMFGDGDEAAMLRALNNIGDPLLDPWFDPDAHGSAGRRIDAFHYGSGGRDCRQDAFFAFLKDQGIDPARVPQQPTPAQGSLASMLPATVGRFTFKATSRIDADAAVDAVTADYATADGIVAHLTLGAFANDGTAAFVRDQVIDGLKTTKKYTELKRGDVVTPLQLKVGEVVLLEGATESVVWSNRVLLGLISGPRDVAWELYNALPF